MAVLAILGSSIAGVLKTGLTSYRHISDDMYTQTEARTALSLITVQLRKHDATGAIEVDSVNKILRLKNDPAYDAGTAIWFDGGALYSAEVSNVDILPTNAADYAIAHVDDLEIQKRVAADGTALEYAVTVYYGTKSLSQTITQRSAS